MRVTVPVPVAAPRTRRLSVACLAVAAALCQWPLQAQPANPIAATLQEYQKRLEGYVELHKKAAAGLPRLGETSSPGSIEQREKLLAEAIRGSRRDARPGDLFGSAAPLIRQVVRRDWATRSAADRRALRAETQEDGPYVGPVVVNMTYPAGVSLATMPPLLLKELPRLPEALEYRLLGRRLILRDVAANLIIDLIDGALPSR